MKEFKSCIIFWIIVFTFGIFIAAVLNEPLSDGTIDYDPAWLSE